MSVGFSFPIEGTSPYERRADPNDRKLPHVGNKVFASFSTHRGRLNFQELLFPLEDMLKTRGEESPSLKELTPGRMTSLAGGEVMFLHKKKKRKRESLPSLLNISDEKRDLNSTGGGLSQYSNAAKTFS